MANSSLRMAAPLSTQKGRSSSHEEALGLVVRLHAEFDAPVALYDPTEAGWASRLGAGSDKFPDPSILHFDSNQASIGHDQGNGNGDPARLWVGLPLPRAGGGTWVAVVAFDGSQGAAHWVERAVLAWGQSVADRIAAEVASRERSVAAGGSALIDQLIRRLRVSERPERFQKRAATAIREAMKVQAVAWIPASSREQPVVAGEIQGMNQDAFAEFVAELGGDRVKICNRSSHASFPAVKRYAVVAADSEGHAGWLLAINPRNECPFPGEVDLLRTVASLLGAQRANARLYGDLKDLLFGVIRALTAAIDAKDPYTSGHSERVARIAVRLGQELGMTSYQQSDLYLMGLLHDVGKIGIEDGVLKKPGKLTPDEYEQIQAHVKIGVHILSDLKKLHHLLPGVAHHHESMDGSGYPSGLRGDAIPLAARILAVADAFDAMSSSRPYRRRMSPPQIDAIFHKGVGVQWDERVVNALFACRADLEHIRQKGLGESLHQVISETLGRA